MAFLSWAEKRAATKRRQKAQNRCFLRKLAGPAFSAAAAALAIAGGGDHAAGSGPSGFTAEVSQVDAKRIGITMEAVLEKNQIVDNDKKRMEAEVSSWITNKVAEKKAGLEPAYIQPLDVPTGQEVQLLNGLVIDNNTSSNISNIHVSNVTSNRQISGEMEQINSKLDKMQIDKDKADHDVQIDSTVSNRNQIASNQQIASSIINNKVRGPQDQDQIQPPAKDKLGRIVGQQMDRMDDKERMIYLQKLHMEEMMKRYGGNEEKLHMGEMIRTEYKEDAARLVSDGKDYNKYISQSSAQMSVTERNFAMQWNVLQGAMSGILASVGKLSHGQIELSKNLIPADIERVQAYLDELTQYVKDHRENMDFDLEMITKLHMKNAHLAKLKQTNGTGQGAPEDRNQWQEILTAQKGMNEHQNRMVLHWNQVQEYLNKLVQQQQDYERQLREALERNNMQKNNMDNDHMQFEYEFSDGKPNNPQNNSGNSNSPKSNSSSKGPQVFTPQPQDHRRRQSTIIMSGPVRGDREDQEESKEDNIQGGINQKMLRERLQEDGIDSAGTYPSMNQPFNTNTGKSMMQNTNGVTPQKAPSMEKTPGEPTNMLGYLKAGVGRLLWSNGNGDSNGQNNTGVTPNGMNVGMNPSGSNNGDPNDDDGKNDRLLAGATFINYPSLPNLQLGKPMDLRVGADFALLPTSNKVDELVGSCEWDDPQMLKKRDLVKLKAGSYAKRPAISTILWYKAHPNEYCPYYAKDMVIDGDKKWFN